MCPKSSSVNRKSDGGVWTPRRALKCIGQCLVGNSRCKRSDYLEESDLLHLDKESRHPQASKLPELKNRPGAGLNQTSGCFSFNVYYSFISLATRRDRGVARVSGVRISRGTRSLASQKCSTDTSAKGRESLREMHCHSPRHGTPFQRAAQWQRQAHDHANAIL